MIGSLVLDSRSESQVSFGRKCTSALGSISAGETKATRHRFLVLLFSFGRLDGFSSSLVVASCSSTTRYLLAYS